MRSGELFLCECIFFSSLVLHVSHTLTASHLNTPLQDMSSALFFGFQALFNSGVTLRALFFAYAILCAVIAVVVLNVYPSSSVGAEGTLVGSSMGDSTAALLSDDRNQVQGSAAADAADTLRAQPWACCRVRRTEVLPKLTLGQQLRTLDFWLLTVFAACLAVKINYYIGTWHDQLAVASSNKIVSADYDPAFNVLLPVGGALAVLPR